MIAAAGTSPKDATSHLSAWWELSGHAAPKWLSDPSADHTAIVVGVILIVVYLLGLWWWEAHKKETAAVPGDTYTAINHGPNGTAIARVDNLHLAPKPAVNMDRDSGWVAKDGGYMRVFAPRYVGCSGLGTATVIFSGGKISGVGCSATYFGSTLLLGQGGDDKEYRMTLADVTAVREFIVEAPEPFDLTVSVRATLA